MVSCDDPLPCIAIPEEAHDVPAPIDEGGRKGEFLSRHQKPVHFRNGCTGEVMRRGEKCSRGRIGRKKPNGDGKTNDIQRISKITHSRPPLMPIYNGRPKGINRQVGGFWIVIQKSMWALSRLRERRLKSYPATTHPPSKRAVQVGVGLVFSFDKS